MSAVEIKDQHPKMYPELSPTARPDVVIDEPTPVKKHIMTQIVSELNGQLESHFKLTDDEIEFVSLCLRKMEKNHPNLDMDITQILYFFQYIRTIYFLKALNGGKLPDEDPYESEEKTEESESELEGEDTSDEESKVECELSETEAEEDKSEEDKSEENKSEEDSESQKAPELRATISVNRIDIPFPITCVFTILMVLYTIQLGMLFCRLANA